MTTQQVLLTENMKKIEEIKMKYLLLIQKVEKYESKRQKVNFKSCECLLFRINVQFDQYAVHNENRLNLTFLFTGPFLWIFRSICYQITSQFSKFN